MEKLIFTDPDTDEEIQFYVLEQTCIAGITYLLVAEEEEEDSFAYILREIRTDEEDIIYEVVEDDEEIRAIAKVFEELIEDIDLEI
ncbi:MAG: DUF1292 domain-containing protein [Lachnospiraceae bacterium]|nr:DUF1292 domain-containing protein [Lachnospiraceae bacterium]